MIVKKILSEDLLTIPETKELLEGIKESRYGEEIELGYELRKTINHVNTFSKVTSEKSRELVVKLSALTKMKPSIAIRIADIKPDSRDELRTIFAKERFVLETSDLDAMLDIIAEAY